MATTITVSPLPVLDSPQIQELRLGNPDCYRAYDMILWAEQHAVQKQENGDIVSARVVGYFLLEFHAQCDTFGESPCASLADWVMAPPQSPVDNQYDVIIGIGRLYRDKFIRLFRTSNVRYPQPSSHPSRAAFDTLEDMIKDSMEVTGKDYKTFRKGVLARDGYQCMVTGIFDSNSVSRCAELAAMAAFDPITTVQICCILNESAMQGIDPAGTSEDTSVVNNTHYAAGAVAILDMFGFSKFTDAFKQSGGVHQMWNSLSLEPNVRSKFDQLKLWFESTDQAGCYKVCVFHKGDEKYLRSAGPKAYVNGAPMVVEFTSKSEKAPLPDPFLLSLHATCARVAHMSGAAEFFDRLQWDAEETNVLASDGSSALLLSHLMSPFTVLEVRG